MERNLSNRSEPDVLTDLRFSFNEAALQIREHLDMLKHENRPIQQADLAYINYLKDAANAICPFMQEELIITAPNHMVRTLQQFAHLSREYRVVAQTYTAKLIRMQVLEYQSTDPRLAKQTGLCTVTHYENLGFPDSSRMIVTPLDEVKFIFPQKYLHLLN